MQDFGRRSFLAGAAALGLANAARAASPMGTARGPVQASWPSLVDNYRYPDWFRDAKLGMWSPTMQMITGRSTPLKKLTSCMKALSES